MEPFGPDESSVLEVDEEPVGSEEVGPQDGLVNIGYVETPCVLAIVNFEDPLAGVIGLDS